MILLGGWAALSASLLPGATSAAEDRPLTGKCSTVDHPWADQPGVALHPGVAAPEANSGPTVYVNSRPSMQDPQTRRYVKGVACQWGGMRTMAETRFLHPELKLMQSEAECGTTNTNDWAFGQKQYDLALKWFGAGASSNLVWNLVLDETGKSTANWAQCSPVVVDSRSGQVTYTPYFYCYKHFSFFVEPGAHLVATESNLGNKLAFVNPDGTVVVVLANPSKDNLPVNLSIDGRQSETVTLPAHSFDTFTLPAGR